MKTIIVTGGAGFIGSAYVLRRVAAGDRVVTLDLLTYAGNRENLASLEGNPNHRLVEGDIRDRETVARLIEEERPDTLVHFAAESHVDRSIDAPEEFVTTNVVGTFVLLDAAKSYWLSLAGERRGAFRFLHVSTDEVFGSLGDQGYFNERTPYSPNSPYSASKAGSDHLARAYFHTYGLPVITTNCSNNYGPRQFPEKLIPLLIAKGLAGEPLPVYGDGGQIRDWLYVDDHCRAIETAIEKGRPGEVYTIGGSSEKTNIDVVKTVCALLDQRHPEGAPHDRLITFVADRPGHDRRYAIDASRMRVELGWRPEQTFETGLAATVDWYLANQAWVERIHSGAYRGERLGLGKEER